MAILRRRQHRARRGWNYAHKAHLRWGNMVGSAFLGDGFWPADEWPTSHRAIDDEAIREEMRECWEDCRDEILDAKWLFQWPGRRPAGWWWFDAPEPRDLNLPEEEQVERFGEMTQGELVELEKFAGMIGNDMWNDPFRRKWAWWKFISPERRKWGQSELIQLVEIERRGGEVLGHREKLITFEHKDYDNRYPFKATEQDRRMLSHFNFTPEERAFLGLPTS